MGPTPVAEGARMTLETARLRLVPVAPQDLVALIDSYEAFAASFGTPAAEGMRDFLFSGEVSPAWLARLKEDKEADPWRYGFALIHRQDDLVIGMSSFKGPPDAAGVVELAYGNVPAYQNRGYATEAAAALIAFAQADGRVRLLRAHTLPETNASTRVLKKCGFDFVGEVTDPEDGPVWRWERQPVIS
jgi:[ribosomal protein S5]-alanine N-acetyltransferase